MLRKKTLAINFEQGDTVYISRDTVVKYLAPKFTSTSNLPSLVMCTVLKTGFSALIPSQDCNVIVRLQFVFNLEDFEIVVFQREIVILEAIYCVTEFSNYMLSEKCDTRDDASACLSRFIANLSTFITPKYEKVIEFNTFLALPTKLIDSSVMPTGYSFYCTLVDKSTVSLNILDCFGEVTKDSYTRNYAGTLGLVKGKMITGRLKTALEVVNGEEVSHTIKSICFVTRGTRLHEDMQNML